MDYFVEDFAVHYPTTYYYHFWREKQSYVQAELSQVESHQLPNLRVIGYLSQSCKIDFQPFSDRFVADHRFNTCLFLMERADSSKMLVLLWMSLSAKL